MQYWYMTAAIQFIFIVFLKLAASVIFLNRYKPSDKINDNRNKKDAYHHQFVPSFLLIKNCAMNTHAIA